MLFMITSERTKLRNYVHFLSATTILRLKHGRGIRSDVHTTARSISTRHTHALITTTLRFVLDGLPLVLYGLALGLGGLMVVVRFGYPLEVVTRYIRRFISS